VDPETKEVLGQIVSTKAAVRVYDVRERFALARTYRTQTVNVGGTGQLDPLAGSRTAFQPPKYVTRVETLRRAKDAGQPIDPKDAAVHVGDIAELVDEDEADDLPSATAWR